MYLPHVEKVETCVRVIPLVELLLFARDLYLGRNGWEGSLSEFCLLFNSLKDSTVGSLKNNSVEM